VLCLCIRCSVEVGETNLALSAFKLMVQNNVSGLAVVNQAGQLTDTISVRDLRGMGVSAQEWTTLSRNVQGQHKDATFS
jgi:hypothetical protein